MPIGFGCLWACACVELFMAVIEHSQNKLRIRSICFGRTGAYASLDRSRNRAAFVWLATILPVKWRTLPLTDIAAVEVRKREAFGGEAYYGLSLQRRRGDTIKFACRSRDEAMHFLKTISAFLAA